MNYYQRHLGDYAKDTGWLSTYQHGVYALLLDWYYSNEKPIPLEIAYRIVKARSGPERRATDEVLLAFFDLNKEPSFAHNKHADIVIAKYRVKSGVNSLIAKERESTKRARSVVDSCSVGEPSHKPVTNSHKEQEQSAPTKPKDVMLPVWIEALQGADAIPAADPIFTWAQSVGLPRDWIALAWWGFEARYADDAKKYTDWRAVFRRAVREDWLKLWRVDRDGSYSLTTAGEQLRREMSA